MSTQYCNGQAPQAVLASDLQRIGDSAANLAGKTAGTVGLSPRCNNGRFALRFLRSRSLSSTMLTCCDDTVFR